MNIRVRIPAGPPAAPLSLSRGSRLHSLGATLVGLVGLALGMFLGTAAAVDWPQFRGPGGDGTSPESGLTRTWPAEGPKVLWTIRLGPGYGGAAIRDGQVYLLDRVD